MTRLGHSAEDQFVGSAPHIRGANSGIEQAVGPECDCSIGMLTRVRQIVSNAGLGSQRAIGIC